MNKNITTLLVLLLMAVAATSIAATPQTLLLPANVDSTGACTDYIVGYGQVLEPINGNWVVTVKNDTTYLNGLPLDPVRHLAKDIPDELFQQALADPQKAAVATAEHALNEAADAAFDLAGIDAALQVYLDSDLVTSAEHVCDNIIVVEWVRSGTEEMIFVTAAERADKEFMRSQAPEPPSPLEHLKASLAKGDGFIFGTGLRSHIPKMHKETFRCALEKKHEKAVLSEEERKVLPPPKHKGFEHVLSGN